MAHPKEADEWVTSIEVDAYPGVEQPEPSERTRPDKPHCPSCGQYQGSPAHGHEE